MNLDEKVCKLSQTYECQIYKSGFQSQATYDTDNDNNNNLEYSL